MPGFGWGGCCGFGALGGYGWIGWIINLALTAVTLIALVLLVIWAVRRITNSQKGSMYVSDQNGGLNAAREILRARYARGEITREEYQQMREGSSALEILAQRYARGEITREQYEIMKRDIS